MLEPNVPQSRPAPGPGPAPPKPERGALVHSWCIPGAFLVHSAIARRSSSVHPSTCPACPCPLGAAMWGPCGGRRRLASACRSRRPAAAFEHPAHPAHRRGQGHTHTHSFATAAMPERPHHRPTSNAGAPLGGFTLAPPPQTCAHDSNSAGPARHPPRASYRRQLQQGRKGGRRGEAGITLRANILAPLQSSPPSPSLCHLAARPRPRCPPGLRCAAVPVATK